MTAQEKCLHIIALLGYNSRQAGVALGVAHQTVDKKMKFTNGNKFTEKDFEKFCNFIESINLEITKIKTE